MAFIRMLILLKWHDWQERPEKRQASGRLKIKNRQAERGKNGQVFQQKAECLTKQTSQGALWFELIHDAVLLWR
jgi:hypothetical protein